MAALPSSSAKLPLLPFLFLFLSLSVLPQSASEEGAMAGERLSFGRRLLGRHPPGVGKHPPGIGKHPPDVGKHKYCKNNASLCYDPSFNHYLIYHQGIYDSNAITCCDNKCVDVAFYDTNNCGKCGFKCAAGKDCFNGQCVNPGVQPNCTATSCPKGSPCKPQWCYPGVPCEGEIFLCNNCLNYYCF